MTSWPRSARGWRRCLGAPATALWCTATTVCVATLFRATMLSPIVARTHIPDDAVRKCCSAGRLVQPELRSQDGRHKHDCMAARSRGQAQLRLQGHTANTVATCPLPQRNKLQQRRRMRRCDWCLPVRSYMAGSYVRRAVTPASAVRGQRRLCFRACDAVFPTQ